jgi:hypothetical protein
MQVDDYMIAHPDGVLGAVHFSVLNDTSVAYVLQSNSTVMSSLGLPTSTRTA